MNYRCLLIVLIACSTTLCRGSSCAVAAEAAEVAENAASDAAAARIPPGAYGHRQPTPIAESTVDCLHPVRRLRSVLSIGGRAAGIRDRSSATNGIRKEHGGRYGEPEP